MLNQLNDELMFLHWLKHRKLFENDAETNMSVVDPEGEWNGDEEKRGWG